MERIGEQQKPLDEAGFGRSYHRRLSPSVRMTAQKHTARNMVPHGLKGRAKSLLISLRAPARRWPVRSRLAERKIAAQYGQARSAERICQDNKERRVAVRSRAVCQYEAIRTSNRRAVQESSNRYFNRNIYKFSKVIHNNCVSAVSKCECQRFTGRLTEKKVDEFTTFCGSTKEVHGLW
jgi:hypothetical protein